MQLPQIDPHRPRPPQRHVINSLRVLYAKENLSLREGLLRYLSLVVFPGVLCNYVLVTALLDLNQPVSPLQLALVLLPYFGLALRLCTQLRFRRVLSRPRLLQRVGIACGGVACGLIALMVYTLGVIAPTGARAHPLFGGYGDFAVFGLLWLAGWLVGYAILLIGSVRAGDRRSPDFPDTSPHPR